MGTYSLNDASITIQPGPQSYHSEQGATVTFDKGLVSKISGDGGQALDAYELEPELITGLSEGQNRTKRRLVSFNEIPPNLVNAVTSIEDRRFLITAGSTTSACWGRCVTICGRAAGQREGRPSRCSLHAVSS